MKTKIEIHNHAVEPKTNIVIMILIKEARRVEMELDFVIHVLCWTE